LATKHSIKANHSSFSSEQSNFGQAMRIVFKPRLFQKPVKKKVQGFEGRIEVQPQPNRDNIIITLVIN